jgi:hypothetical protein
MRIQAGKRSLGLLVEFVKEGDVAAQDFLVAIELQADAVDLVGYVDLGLDAGDSGRIGHDRRQRFAHRVHLSLLGV